MTSIQLTDAAQHYRSLPQQQEALKYLQEQTSAEVLAKFAELWRKAPPLPPEFVTLDDLLKITLVAPKERLQKFVAPLNQHFEKYKVNTPLRVCHFLAQVLHESGEFQYQEEIASGADYEWRDDLGNCKPGDGVRFKGRGLIQVTGRSNYADLSKAVGIDYLNNPTKLACIPDCLTSAFWYWSSRNLSALADKDDFDTITLRINGGYNGYDDRRKYLLKAKEVLM